MLPLSNRRWLIFAATLLFLAGFTHARVFSAGNDASRFAQIEALVDYGQTNIDASRYRWTVDRVGIGGKEYSNKPPVLSLIGAGAYFILKHAFGLSFARHEPAVLYLLTLILIGGSTAWLVANFYDALEQSSQCSPRARTLATIALAAGTILTSYSATFNNHTPAAACLFAACRAAWSGQGVRAGIYLSLTVLIDIVPGVLFVPVLGWMLLDTRQKSAIAGYGASLAAGAAVFAATSFWILGYPLPAKMVPGAVDLSSRFAPSVAGVLLPDDWSYPVKCLFGWHGFFSVSPVLFLGTAGLVGSMRHGQILNRKWSCLLGAACAVMILGHIVFVGSFGGWSYGFRYLIPIIPILMYFAPGNLETLPKGLTTAMLALSISTALIGAYHPWPPGYEQEAEVDPVASLVTNPVGGNLTARVAKSAPDSALTRRLCALFISPDPDHANQYLRLFFASKGDARTAEKFNQKLKATSPL